VRRIPVILLEGISTARPEKAELGAPSGRNTFGAAASMCVVVLALARFTRVWWFAKAATANSEIIQLV
jgi:hypothetical protein